MLKQVKYNLLNLKNINILKNQVEFLFFEFNFINTITII